MFYRDISVASVMPAVKLENSSNLVGNHGFFIIYTLGALDSPSISGFMLRMSHSVGEH
jgi:hypothetical protein